MESKGSNSHGISAAVTLCAHWVMDKRTVLAHSTGNGAFDTSFGLLRFGDGNGSIECAREKGKVERGVDWR